MQNRMEVRYWLAVAVSIIALACAKLYGFQLSWLVVLAPLWLPPILFFWFAAIATAFAALAMSQKPKTELDGDEDRWPTVRERFLAWLSTKTRRNTNLSVAVMASAHVADTAQAASSWLVL